MSEEIPQAPNAPEYGAPMAPAVGAPMSVRDEMTEPPRMSPFARLANVAFSPTEVFEDVRRSPRDWWLPLVVLILLSVGASVLVQQRLGLTPETMAKAATDMAIEQQGKTRKDLSAQEKEQFANVEKFQAAFFKFTPLFPVIGVPIVVFLLAGLYRLILLVMQAQTTFFRVLSVVCYSYFVAAVVKTLLTVAFAFIKNPDDIDAATIMKQGDLISASPAMLVSVTDHPVLRAFLSYIDLFSFWWLALAAIGLVAVSRKLKMGGAALTVGAPYVAMMIFSVLIALMRAH